VNPDPSSFVRKFSEVWAAPEPDAFAALWHPDGVLLHPTMENAMPQSEIPEYVRQVKAVLPDISLAVRHWAASGDVVLIEFTVTATFRGEALSWEGVDRFTLRGDRAIEGIAYFDTAPLWRRLGEGAPQGHILDAAAEEPAASSA
jgi:hypothetical protein